MLIVGEVILLFCCHGGLLTKFLLQGFKGYSVILNRRSKIKNTLTYGFGFDGIMTKPFPKLFGIGNVLSEN